MQTAGTRTGTDSLQASRATPQSLKNTQGACWRSPWDLHGQEGLRLIVWVLMEVWPQFGLLWWLRGKEAPCRCKRCEFNPWVGKSTWRKKWQPTPVFLPRKSHGQRNLADCRPGGSQKSWIRLSDSTTTMTATTMSSVCSHRFWRWKGICGLGINDPGTGHIPYHKCWIQEDKKLYLYS